MTAAAWTPTPVPTPTATPIPYDLTVHIADETGAPIAGASIVVTESGSSEPVLTDSSGQYTWSGLNGPTVSLNAYAPGFHAAVQALSLERGPSEMALVLQRDPLGLTASDACAADEKLLYIEDFQSGEAPKWRVTTPGPGTWSVKALEDGNEVGSVSGIGVTQVELPGFVFDNVVWRMRVMAAGSDGQSFLNLKHFRAGGDTSYVVQWGPTPRLGLLRTDAAEPEKVMAAGRFRAQAGMWNTIEVSYYQGMVQVWVDGQKEAEFQDPAPLPPGTISIAGHINADPTMAYYFDNMSVCELERALRHVDVQAAGAIGFLGRCKRPGQIAQGANETAGSGRSQPLVATELPRYRPNRSTLEQCLQLAEILPNALLQFLLDHPLGQLEEAARFAGHVHRSRACRRPSPPGWLRIGTVPARRWSWRHSAWAAHRPSRSTRCSSLCP